MKPILILLLTLTGFASAQPPNIVLITADDLGMHLGCYGYDGIDTPNLDRMAAQGILFERAYVTQASCSPSRSSIFTGLYPHQNGQVGLGPFSKYGYRMAAGTPTLPRLLKVAGYRTAILGKIHVEPQTPNLFPSETKTGSAPATLDVEKVAAQAEVFIGKDRTPFFLMVNYFDPHRVPHEGEHFADQFMGYPKVPVKPAEVKPFDFQGGLDFPDLRNQIAGYLNGVKRLDDGIGLLMETLEKSGVADNTLIIFISDHGAPFTLAKCSVLEAGVQVPMIAQWPGRMAAGKRTDFLTSSIDLLPTLLAAAEVKAPDGLPGLNLLPLLESGTPGDLRRELLFTEFTAHAAGHYYPRRAVRNDRFKLIWNLQSTRKNPLTALNDKATQVALKQSPDSIPHQIFKRWVNPPEYELYDLHEDPHEFRNLAGDPSHADMEETLKNALVEWRVKTNDLIGPDTPNPSEKTKKP